MNLKEIGFYTLSDERAIDSACETSVPYNRCELILTDVCNFKCPYCKGLRSDCKGVMPYEKAKQIIDIWAENDIQNVRFSGGEPTTYKNLLDLILYTKFKCRHRQGKKGIQNIALSTNGSADIEYYRDLIVAGITDFSISLDACCSSFGKKMSGGVDGAWEKVIENIRAISRWTYVTTGIVFTEDNMGQAKEIVEFADSLGVRDIRIISSAQFNDAIEGIEKIDDKILERHPILRYRVNNFRQKRNVRGMYEGDSKKCHIVKDDMAVAGNFHFPCIIYLREGGDAIGKMDEDVKAQRYEWFKNHDCSKDKICKNNCLDICTDYNNKAEHYAKYFAQNGRKPI